MPNLKYIFSKKIDETYSINWYDGPQKIEDNGYKFRSESVKGIIDIKTFSDDTFNESKNKYFTKFLKYKYGDVWSELIPLNDIINSGLTFSCMGVENIDTINDVIDPEKELILELYYIITVDNGIPNTSILEVNNIKISGEYVLNTTDETFILPNSGDEIILAPEDIYKIFKLEDYNLLSNHNNVDIKYRFTQDNNRTYTKWTPLTTENIAATKLNPLRFAKVEYLIKNLGTPLIVYDILLVGDFQNVSANYLKTNKYGLKEDCVVAAMNGGGDNGSNNGNGGYNNNNSNCSEFLNSCSSYSENTANELDKENASNSGSYWNPYNQKNITDFANMLGNQITEMFGWDVNYHITDPDGNGEDVMLHEYTLKNIVDVKRLRIIVPDNKFPVESVIINNFNLDLFDTFEIHIMKDEFKKTFGITRRPAEDDIIDICQTNMLYYIKHAQAFKDIMNAATYYKIILEKYEYKTNIRNVHQESKKLIDELTDNSTIDDLFQNEIDAENDKISNKIQMKPTTMDFIRHKIYNGVDIEQETLIIDDFTPVKSIYNLSNKSLYNKVAIDYKKGDKLIKSDNRSFIFWFKINNEYDENSRISNKLFNAYSVPTNQKFNLLNNYKDDLGYDIYYNGTNLIMKLNDMTYNLEEKLLTNIWYIGVINLNQQQHNLDMKLYTRNGNIQVVYINEQSHERKLVDVSNSADTYSVISDGFKPVSNVQSTKSTDLILLNEKSTTIEPVEFNIDTKLQIKGSNIKYSNLRIFNDIIPELMIKNIIKENIIKESQFLILADNATKTIKATNYYNKNWL